MPANRTTLALALVLGATAGTSPSLMADPPGITEAEMEAYLAQYRQAMRGMTERERAQEQQAAARRQAMRAPRERHDVVGVLVRDAEEKSREAPTGRVLCLVVGFLGLVMTGLVIAISTRALAQTVRDIDVNPQEPRRE